jgi:hypothetical protein
MTTLQTRPSFRASGIDPERVIYSKDLYRPSTVERLKSLQATWAILAWWAIHHQRTDPEHYAFRNAQFSSPVTYPTTAASITTSGSIVEDQSISRVSLHFITNGR